MKLTPTFLFGGCATLTVETSHKAQHNGLKPHYTYRVRAKADGSGAFVELLCGPDNTRGSDDWRYLCYLSKNGTVGGFTPRSCRKPNDMASAIIRRVVACIFAGTTDAIERADWKLHHGGKCCRCGHDLTTPASVETGIGPECETFVRLGMEPKDVPQVNHPEVARLQYVYWMTGDTLLIDMALPDVVMEHLGFDRDRAALLCQATRKLMRKHKKGAKLTPQFLAVAGAAAERHARNARSA